MFSGFLTSPEIHADTLGGVYLGVMMKTSDKLTKLCQMTSILELEDQPINQYGLVMGLMEAFDTQSSAHLVQIIRDAVVIKEILVEAHEEIEQLGYISSKLNELALRAYE